ncbi:hypothetical protein, partial [Streptomyces griseorubiginosus]|uniref:hypothetical protein n=1 Tax=Streptomyces griseorubiginosus TaxID=67304 RepID=UPI0036662884
MDSQMGDSEQEGLREDVLLSLDSLEAPSVGALPSPSALRDLENARRNHKIQMGFHTLQKQTSYLRLCGAALIVGLSSVCYIIAWAPSNTTLWIIPISEVFQGGHRSSDRRCGHNAQGSRAVEGGVRS